MKRTLILGIVFSFQVYGIFAQAPSQLPKPFNRVDLLALVIADPRGAHIEPVIAQRGIDFQPTEDYLGALKTAGAFDKLIAAVRKAPVRPREACSAGVPTRVFTTGECTLIAGGDTRATGRDG